MRSFLRSSKPYVTMFFIAVNAFVFLYMEIIDSTENVYFMMEHGAVYAPYIFENKEYYRLITSIFMHFGIGHILNNMLSLFILGGYLEHALGKIKYFFFYLLCGIGANIVSLFYHNWIGESVSTVSAGASGAIFGVFGGLLYAIIINKGYLDGLNQRQMIIMIVISIYYGFASNGVDNAAHLGGLAIGIILGAILYRKSRFPKNYWGERW